MQIKEVEELLQISSYALRYYEKMELLNPSRDENGYRNYSQEDIQKIRKIHFLRELEIPVEDIYNIIHDTVSFQVYLENHTRSLGRKIKSLEYVQEVCNDLKEKGLPLLDTITNEKILKEENIDSEKIKFGIKKAMYYLKPLQTVVLGTRVDPKNYFLSYIFSLILSLFGGFIIGMLIINFINSVEMNHRYLSGGWSVVVGCIICFIISTVFMTRHCSRQEYIELTDQGVSVCSKKYQSKISIFLGMITKSANRRNKNYSYSDISKVEIVLIFSTTSGGYSGLWHTYVPRFHFYFNDNDSFVVDAGVYFGDNQKDAYKILREKNVDIHGEDLVIEYFEQEEKKCYDFFEEHYHRNIVK